MEWRLRGALASLGHDVVLRARGGSRCPTNSEAEDSRASGSLAHRHLGAAVGGLLATVAGLHSAVLVAAVAVPLVALPLLGSALRTVREMPGRGVDEPAAVSSA
jgi:hypothetical protein